ncbi:DUF3868 domain-containing protein [Proteiniphilum sp. X52]|uniref:OmpA family protein n=1 Tax=Proteiniphilum sp. X52 TaxID=2382159 RepID=UPI001314FA7E|nr:DUF3868 domain-containing protein [Proteiniphilum sp. X52]
MKKFLYICILVLTAATASAQTRYINNVKFGNLTREKVNDRVQIAMDVLLSDLQLNTNDMLILTPVLYSNNSADSMAFAPMAVLGKVRNRIVERNTKLNNPVPLPAGTQAVVARKNRTEQTLTYNGAVPYVSWMRNANLKVLAAVKGCADCGEGLGELLLTQRLFDEPYQPSYKLTYIVPEVEPVKARADRHTATFNYVVGKHELLRHYKNNASEFERVDKVINEVKNNKDIQITEFTVAGYASPEGNFNSNRALADRRANSFADYLSNTHGISRSQFRVTGYGEDWDGLKRAVEKSQISDKDEILRIIASVANPDARDAQLMKLSGGTTYRTLLNNYYPPLRRTDYTIAYNVRAFSVEEAREIIKTNPKLLSLNEMYLVAQSYPADSKEFKEVFDIATRMYPDEPIALLNSAAADIEMNSNRAAIERLEKMQADPRTWNNLGVAYARLGEMEKAKDYFQRAAAQGDADAKANLEELEKAMEN